MSAAIVVWRFTDGKAGHENQVEGLVTALRERRPLEEFVVHTSDCRKGLVECIRGHDPFGVEHASPDLIIGAGHATHLPMLNARRIRGGRVIVLMKPTLPTSWFDLCIIPAHDHPRHADNILVTQGVLHRVRPSAQHDATQGLILVGGPSAHVNWSNEAMAAQVHAVLAGSPAIHWTLATSRRTPPGFTDLLPADAAQLSVVPVEQTGSDWLPGRLATAGTVWVSADSVSMVYEALGAGAAVGLLPVPWRKDRDRLLAGLHQLLHDHRLTDFAHWQAGSPLHPSTTVLDEAGRCADWILERWLPTG
jgi:mitochondrial fission protein ELM1